MKQYTIRYGLVVNTDDPQQSGRIYIKLGDTDSGVDNTKLKEAYPILPLHMNILPQKGEAVLAFISSAQSDDSTPAYYMGPIISNPTKLEGENAAESLQKMEGSPVAKDKDMYLNKETKGAIADPNDVALYGRKNSDVILGTKALAIRHNVRRCTKQDDNTPPLTTDVDTSSAMILNEDSVNIIGKKIHLIGTRGPKGEALTTKSDNKYIATQDAFQDWEKNTYRALLGEQIVEYLKLLTEAFIQHTHRMEGEEPFKDKNIKTLETKLGTISNDTLSNNIFLN